MTWGAKMPSTFPVSTPQNSGNMVHAQAPFTMFPNAVGRDFGWKEEGHKTFVEFVNKSCDAVIIPFANTIRTDPAHDDNGAAVARSLDNFTVPVIPFGVGAQAATMDVDKVDLGPGMQALIRKLVEVSPAVSVRGSFTYQLFEKYASTGNVHNTGCPSFFSRPESFGDLRGFLDADPQYREMSFSGSLHHLETPKRQLYSAILQDLFVIEPVNAKLHQYYLDSVRADVEAQVPYFLAGFLKQSGWGPAELQSFLARRYRLFRDLDSWIAFNRESSEGAIGTRFHVNMASLLSGRPAVWVVHDSRTIELCDKLALPHVSMEESLSRPYRDLMRSADYGPMFQKLDENFAEFNGFLRAAGLPEVSAPALTQAS